MKAIVRDRYGPAAEVLRVAELETPMSTGDQVLVRVEAASLNAADIDMLHARPAMIRLLTGLRAPRNPRLGVDVAGRVEAVGESVTRFRPGDTVFGDLFSFGMGSFAEYVCAPERAFLPVPPSMPLDEAATLPHAAVLALQSIRAGRPPREGERLLINGASGNVGPFAIQIAKAFGMHVTGVSSTAKLDFVASIGADEVIDYTLDDFARMGRRWDRIVDIFGTRSMPTVRRALTRDGVYTWVGGGSGNLLQAVLFGAGTFVATRQRIGLTFGWRPFHAPDVAALVELYEAGKLKPIIDRRFPFEEAIDAIRYVDEGRHRGKVVITSD